MNKKSLIVTLATFTLVSCNNGKMAKISEDRAKELANEIIARQEDPQVFAQPKKFIYKYSGKTIANEYNSSGKTKTESTLVHVFEFNLDKLVCRDYQKQTSLGYSYEKERITYYDNVGLIRHLDNENGRKTRKEEQYDATEAKEQFEAWRSEWKNTYTWNHNQIGGDGTLPFALSSYSDSLTKYQDLRERYKNEKDQYCRIYVGSSGAKTLQTIVNIKENASDDSGFSGYSTHGYSTTIKNDLFSSCTVSVIYDLKQKDDKRFYYNSTNTASSSMTYGDVKIYIPNYLNYDLAD